MGDDKLLLLLQLLLCFRFRDINITHDHILRRCEHLMPETMIRNRWPHLACLPDGSECRSVQLISDVDCRDCDL